MTPSQKVNDFFAQYPAKTFMSGQLLMRPSEGQKVFYIKKGVVTQYDISSSGEKLIVNIYKSGAFLPLPSIVADIPVTLFFEASTETAVHVAPRLDVQQFLRGDAEVLYDTLARLARGSNGLLHRTAHIMEGGAEARIYYELEMLRARFAGELDVITATVTQLASQTGLARETVSRALKRMREQGVVRSSKGKYAINDAFTG